ncbi:MAG TPA: hypothetical protein VEW08_17585, partial [Steroidobacteraceae bacterium]|nr:hypothetical protein [Steroidobacteraceae bacterium]
MSAAADLEDLLAKLRGLEKGTTLDEALAMLRPPEPAAVIETRRRCALVRAFDKDVYAELTRDLPDAPKLKDFVASNDVRRQGPQRWAFDELTRNALLRAWKLTDTDFRNWNGRLAKFFLGRNRPEERLDAMFHLAASPQPDEGAEYFEKWYAEADAKFDLAHCNALLEILRVREATRGTKLTRAWNDHRQFYQARQFFGDDYFKTGAYFERDEPLKKFEQLLKDGSKQWIYHVHATGGTGKTMFLRWLAARYLVPMHIPCARIDFDDFPLSGVLEYPNRIFTRIIDQLASQVPGGVLTALREKLQRELESPGWNSNVPEEIGRQLRGANLQTNLVVMLDTLEDVTRTAKVWLKTCLQTLRRLHELHPRLVVVLSGRYDISVHTNALLPGEAVVYELMRFSVPEADAYLAKRGIPKGDARTALVERAGENAELDDDKLAGRNPFKLAMFAELALNKTGLTAEMVRQLPRVDIAYLIQRVIMRISSQPLRWAVRYGVVVRHLNKAVVDAVLLPALKEALRGKTADDPNSALGDFSKVWEPDPALAETVTTDDIWNELKTYVRERGWISLSGSEADGTEELRFHPDVVTPTRALLRDQTIYRDLQRHAAEFFHANSGLDDAQAPPDADAAVRNACEAVFHRFQVDGPAARDYWHANLRKIEGWFGLDSAVRYASEICGPAFALAQVDPMAPFMNAAVLREAHCEAADLLLQTIAHRAIDSGAEFTQFQLHVEWAKAVATKHGLPPVPKFLVAIHDAASAKTGRAIEMLEEARRQALDPRERVFLTLVLARRVREESPQDSARYLEEALPDLPSARRVWVQAYSIAFELLRLYQALGDHGGVMRTLDTLRGAAGQQRMFLDPVDQAAAGYSLEIGDLETAAACIERLKSSSVPPRRSAVTDLEAQLALERGEVLKVITLAREGLAGVADQTDSEGLRADFHALQGVAHKHLLAYTDAFDCFERAGVVF